MFYVNTVKYQTKYSMHRHLIGDFATHTDNINTQLLDNISEYEIMWHS